MDDSFRCPYSDAKCGRHLCCEIYLQAKQTAGSYQERTLHVVVLQSMYGGISRQISHLKNMSGRLTRSQTKTGKHDAPHTESTIEIKI